MTKTLLIIASLALLTLAQETPNRPLIRTNLEGIQNNASTGNWSCNFNFLSNNVSQFNETMGPDRVDAVRLDLVNGINNNISDFSWQGDSCSCWVILYENDGYEGDKLGLWIGTNEGSYDLSNFVIEDSDNDNFDLSLENTDDNLTDTDDDTDTDWRQWNNAVSSYRIFCY